MRRPVSAANPLVLIHPPIEHFEEAWERLPPTVRPCCAVAFHAARYLGPESERRIRSELDRATSIGAPAWVYVLDHSRHTPFPLRILEDLLDKYPVVKGLAATELSGGRMPEWMVAWLAAMIDLCARTDALAIWQDMAYPHWEHVFLRAGAHERLFASILAHGSHVALVDKQNGRGQYFLTRAAVLGMWASGIVTAWGVNPEDWWWYEMGFGRPGTQSRGPRGYAIDHTPEEEAGWGWASCLSAPDALYGQTMVTATAAGASIYSFECPAHAHGAAGPDGTFAFSPAWKHVILPLLERIAAGLLPSREEVLERLPVAYRCRSLEEPEIDLPGERLFRPLYGARRSDPVIRCTGVSPEFINRTGRYFFLPVLPALAPGSSDEPFRHVIRAGRFTDEPALRAFFDDLFPDERTGEACVLRVGERFFVTNTRENEEVTEDFACAPEGGPIRRLEGTLPVHTYLLVSSAGGCLELHLNNYLVDTHIWDEPLPERFDVAAYCRRYITEPDDRNLRATELRLGSRDGRRPKVAWSGYRVEVEEYWDERAAVLRLRVRHNGPVDLSVAAETVA